MCYTIHTSCCITHYMKHTDLNFTTGNVFCWPTLLKCIHYIPWRWPSGLKHNGVRKVLIKWWYNNIWVELLVFIRYSDISAWNKKDKVPILCFPSASWNTIALSLLQEKQYYLVVSLFEYWCSYFCSKEDHTAVYQGVCKFWPTKVQEGTLISYYQGPHIQRNVPVRTCNQAHLKWRSLPCTL
jgi:hypothetical protein